MCIMVTDARVTVPRNLLQNVIGMTAPRANSGTCMDRNCRDAPGAASGDVAGRQGPGQPECGAAASGRRRPAPFRRKMRQVPARGAGQAQDRRYRPSCRPAREPLRAGIAPALQPCGRHGDCQSNRLIRRSNITCCNAAPASRSGACCMDSDWTWRIDPGHRALRPHSGRRRKYRELIHRRRFSGYDVAIDSLRGSAGSHRYT